MFRCKYMNVYKCIYSYRDIYHSVQYLFGDSNLINIKAIKTYNIKKNRNLKLTITLNYKYIIHFRYLIMNTHIEIMAK